MFDNNFILQEALANVFDPTPAVQEIKKALNTCALTKFRSQDSCANFYSKFFMNSLELKDELNFPNWIQIYQTLLSDRRFTENLSLYMSLYHPRQYLGMFQSLVNLMDVEVGETKVKIRYLSDAKAFFVLLQNSFESITATVIAQTNDLEAMKFCSIVRSVLTSKIFYINELIRRVIDENHDPNDIAIIHDYMSSPLDEDWQELFSMLEHADEYIERFRGEVVVTEQDMLDEGIVSKAGEAMKTAGIEAKKAVRMFDELCMKAYRNAVAKRQQRKHSEMVGESLRINNELKRILKVLPLSLLGPHGPVLAIIAWVISIVVDRATDQKDRNVLIGQLKDEIEIVEEKIQMAERNGDDKAKIELIRLRQKLAREYERINRIPFQGTRRNGYNR